MWCGREDETKISKSDQKQYVPGSILQRKTSSDLENDEVTEYEA